MHVRLWIVDHGHVRARLVEDGEPGLGATHVEDVAEALLHPEPAEDVEVHGVAAQVVCVLMRECEGWQRGLGHGCLALHLLHLVEGLHVADGVEELRKGQCLECGVGARGHGLGRVERLVVLEGNTPPLIRRVVLHCLRHGPGSIAKAPDVLRVHRVHVLDDTHLGALLVGGRILGAQGQEPRSWASRRSRRGSRTSRAAGKLLLLSLEALDRRPRLRELGTQSRQLLKRVQLGCERRRVPIRKAALGSLPSLWAVADHGCCGHGASLGEEEEHNRRPERRDGQPGGVATRSLRGVEGRHWPVS
mmetsp:Transcript_12585/g.33705  ORF Transcript_12585/g.33705 Transcript_12585/m.33705 type:complete len:304 (+) Transcript_12585:129-1040(+)